MISVIIPVYNRPAMIAAALHSVLEQSLKPDEILVVDDGSTDETAARVDAFSPRVRRIHQTNQGVAAARNHGLREAAGDLMVFLDSDDLLASDALAILSEALADDPICDLVYGCMVLFRDEETTGVEGTGTPVFLPGTFLCRSRVFQQLGGLNLQLGAGEWIDWYSRAQAAGVVMKPVMDVILHRRIHPGNMTRQRASSAPHYANMLALHLKRRRAQAGLGE